MIAALYIDERGPYAGRLDVDAWGISRDAKLYDGPHAVVAHPPCRNYSALRHLATGDDSDCGPRAVEQVRAFGGVLEHPAYSKLWERCDLPLPGAPADAFDGFTVQVEQVSWGHVARKRTWLYFVGVDRAHVGATIRYGGTPTHWCSGFRSSTSRTPARYKQNGCAVPPGIKVCSAQQRRRTPPAFAEWLIALAHSALRDRAWLLRSAS